MKLNHPAEFIKHFRFISWGPPYSPAGGRVGPLVLSTHFTDENVEGKEGNTVLAPEVGRRGEGAPLATKAQRRRGAPWTLLLPCPQSLQDCGKQVLLCSWDNGYFVIPACLPLPPKQTLPTQPHLPPGWVSWNLSDFSSLSGPRGLRAGQEAAGWRCSE